MDIRKKKAFLGTTAVMVAISPLVAMQMNAYAATPALANVPAHAAINSSVDLYPGTDLNFATLTQTGAAGTVNIGFTDNISNVGGTLTPAGGSATSGLVTMKVAPGLLTKISSSAATYKITTLGGGMPSRSLTVSSINYRVGATTGPSLSITPTGAINAIDIGANLKSSAVQAQGTYVGAIKVQVTQP